MQIHHSLRACLKSSGGPLACRRGRHLAARTEAGSREDILVISGSPTRLAPFPPGETPRLHVGQDGRRYIFRQSLSSALSISLGLLLTTTSLSADDAKPEAPLKRKPIERLATARLQATHEDVQKLKALRRTVPPLPGLYDYRSILHAHAEDSAHTGGTRPEMLADAKKADVKVIMLTDHFRPPRDFMDSWRGMKDGVLFIPGSEIRGFLIYPTNSILAKMDSPAAEFIPTVSAGEGLIFLSHIEERPDHSMEGLTGQEIYNRHADAKKDMASLIALAMRMTDPKQTEEFKESLRLYPEELLAFQVDYPADYLNKWDHETQKRRLTGVAANDCHHNQVFVVKMVDENSVRIGTNVDPDDGMRLVTASSRPGIKEMTKNHKPGDVLVSLDLDPYYRSFWNVSTHILAPEQNEKAIRAALKAGHAYVSHDWMCDPTGFRFEALAKGASKWQVPSKMAKPSKSPAAIMGDEIPFTQGMRLAAQFPLTTKIRLLKDGKVIHEETQASMDKVIEGPGVYRVEGWLTLDGEARGWIYANPIYVR